MCAMLGRQRKRDEGKPTLVLDLDDTLMASFRVTLYEVRLILRPGVRRFLEQMSEFYEIVVFTASPEKSAQEKIQLLDPEGEFISVCLTKSDCRSFYHLDDDFRMKECPWMQLKDLQRDFGRDLSRVVWLDDKGTQQLFRNTALNGLDAKDFADPRRDTFLEDVTPLLGALAKLGDVRPALFQLRVKQECAVSGGFLWFRNEENDGWHVFGTRKTDLEPYSEYQKNVGKVLRLWLPFEPRAIPAQNGLVYVPAARDLHVASAALAVALLLRKNSEHVIT